MADANAPPATGEAAPPQPIVSPPPTISTSETTPTPDPSSSTDPISPITRTGTFPHKSAAGIVSPARPFISVSTPAINDDPVELDSVDTSTTSPQELRGESGGGKGGKVVSPGLGEDEDIAEEFLGEGETGVGRGLREKRAAMLASRSKDPSVIVDVPQDPTAEEVEAAKSGEGTVTPAVPAGEFESK